MNAVQAHIQKWISANYSSCQKLSVHAGRSKSYVTNVMRGDNSSVTAVAVLDDIVHFPDGVLDKIKPFRRKYKSAKRDINALLMAWPVQEKRV